MIQVEQNISVEALRLLRCYSKKSQREIGFDMGYTRAAVSAIECGRDKDPEKLESYKRVVMNNLGLGKYQNRMDLINILDDLIKAVESTKVIEV